jgi:hypothetical protein
MVESHDELITEIAMETGLNHMGDDAEDEDNDDRGDATTPPVAVAPPPTPTPLAAAHKEITVNEEDPVEMVPEQEAPVPHEVTLAGAEPELPQPYLCLTLMRDHEESCRG